MNEILILCSGNIIRSAFVELYAKHLGLYNISSAGTTYFNQSISYEAKNKLLELGVDRELINAFKPRHLSQIENSEYLVYGMTDKHLTDYNLWSHYQNDVKLISELSNSKENVLDPYFHNNYDDVFEQLIILTKLLVKLYS